MSKYLFPAVITEEENGLFDVYFPDIPDCYTSGESLMDALYMAEDVLAFTLYTYERDNKTIPSPSRVHDIKCSKCSFVNIISCDTLEYQKRNNNKAVKKTLTIPEWLNELAVKADINFSQVLQEALKKKMNVT